MRRKHTIVIMTIILTILEMISKDLILNQNCNLSSINNAQITNIKVGVFSTVVSNNYVSTPFSLVLNIIMLLVIFIILYNIFLMKKKQDC